MSVLSARIAEDIAFISFFPIGCGTNEFNNPQLSRVAVRHYGRPAKLALVGLLAYLPVRLAILGLSWIAHLQENVATGRIGLTEEDRTGLALIAGARQRFPLAHNAVPVMRDIEGIGSLKARTFGVGNAVSPVSDSEPRMQSNADNPLRRPGRRPR